MSTGRGSRGRSAKAAKSCVHTGACNHPDDSDEDEVNDQPFNAPSEMTDLILSVEGGTKKLHVNKSVLMIASPVFKAMFTHSFKEKGASVIELKDKKYSNMVYFLRCIYPDIVEPITQINVHRVLPLLDEYQCDCHIHRCEDFLLRYAHEVGTNMKPKQMVRFMLHADRYNMRKLLETMAEVAAKINSEQLDVVPGFDDISAEGKFLIFFRRTRELQKFITAIKSSGKFAMYPPDHEKIEKYNTIKKLFNNADFL